MERLGENDEVIRLMGGSTWLLRGYAYFLVPQDILIVVQDGTLATAYIDGNDVPVQLIGGFLAWQSGRLETVWKALGDGAVLQLQDGSLWEVDNYDHYHTRFWLPPYQVLIDGSGRKMLNLEEQEWIHVRRAR